MVVVVNLAPVFLVRIIYFDQPQFQVVVRYLQYDPMLTRVGYVMNLLPNWKDRRHRDSASLEQTNL
jgi:hypothetical protein